MGDEIQLTMTIKFDGQLDSLFNKMSILMNLEFKSFKHINEPKHKKYYSAIRNCYPNETKSFR